MLPNHNPFVIAEQFGALDALFPGRIDLGLGRAPGAAPILAQALRKDLSRAAEFFPQDVVELRALFTGDPDLPIRATPGFGAQVELWMLGSSLFGAQLAEQLGLPYAFASHFAPDQLDAALETYRRQFRPSAALARPHVMAAMTVICGESDEEAELLASSQDQAFVRLRSGDPGKLPPPVPGYRDSLPGSARAMLDRLSVARAVGSPETVATKIEAFIERTAADEIIVSGATYDPAARRRIADRVSAGDLAAPTHRRGPDVVVGEGAVFCDFTVVTALEQAVHELLFELLELGVGLLELDDAGQLAAPGEDEAVVHVRRAGGGSDRTAAWASSSWAMPCSAWPARRRSVSRRHRACSLPRSCSRRAPASSISSSAPSRASGRPGRSAPPRLPCGATC